LVRRELGEGALGAEAEGFLARELAGAAAALAAGGIRPRTLRCV